MKALTSLLVLSFAVAIAAPALAGGDKPKTQAECGSAKDMIWDRVLAPAAGRPEDSQRR
jgi:hypothetical protein